MTWSDLYKQPIQLLAWKCTRFRTVTVAKMTPDILLYFEFAVKDATPNCQRLYTRRQEHWNMSFRFTVSPSAGVYSITLVSLNKCRSSRILRGAINWSESLLWPHSFHQLLTVDAANQLSHHDIEGVSPQTHTVVAHGFGFLYLYVSVWSRIRPLILSQDSHLDSVSPVSEYET